MDTLMTQFKTTANAHMQRELDAKGKWDCACEACHGIRSLMGMDKMLAVRPLVREIKLLQDRMQGLPEGAERRSLQEQYLKLQDKLADVIAK